MSLRYYVLKTCRRSSGIVFALHTPEKGSLPPNVFQSFINLKYIAWWCYKCGVITYTDTLSHLNNCNTRLTHSRELIHGIGCASLRASFVPLIFHSHLCMASASFFEYFSEKNREKEFHLCECVYVCV